MDHDTEELYAVGIKNISLNENLQYDGLYPTGLILESIGQLTGALFILYKNGIDDKFFFGMIQNVHVYKKVKLGNQLKLTTKITKIKDSFFSFRGEASVNGEVVVSIENSIVVKE